MYQRDYAGRVGIHLHLAGYEDLYNATQPIDGALFERHLQDSLEAWDALDGNASNGVASLVIGHKNLARIIAEDAIWADLDAAPCSDGYLDIMHNVSSCGGHSLSQDVWDRWLQAIVDASGTTLVSDSVEANDATHSDTFPYVAAPH